MSIIQGTAKATAGDDSFYDFPIGQSLRFNGSSYLSKSLSSGSTTKFTYSFWVKRSVVSASGTNDILWYQSNGTGYVAISYLGSNLRFYDVTDNSTTDENADIRSERVFRDLSAFYHIVIAVDASQTSLNDKFKLYVNGISSSLASSSFFNDSTLSVMNTATTAYIGNQSDVFYLSSYMAEINFIDGTALTPTSLGETKNGLWIPKDPSGLTYGTNGFRLTFSNASDFGEDSSGNDNDWTVN